MVPTTKNLVVFLALVLVTSIAYHRMSSRSYAPGEEPGHFIPVVLHVAESKPAAYRLVKADELRAVRSAEPQLELELPEPQGSFTEAGANGAPMQVSFRATPEGGAQKVEVKYATDDYRFEAEYRVNGDAIEPRRLFSGHAMTLAAALVLGIIAALALQILFAAGEYAAKIFRQQPSRDETPEG